MSNEEFLFEAETWEEKVYRNQHTIVNDWLRSKETTGKSRRTLNSYSRTARKFFHEELDLTGEIEDWREDLIQYGRSSRYIVTQKFLEPVLG